MAARERRTHSLLAAGLVLLAAGGCRLAPDAGSPSRQDHPNILIIYTDDVGYGDVGCYGVGSIDTPRIDALAATGRRFTQVYSSAATCTPSRYSLLTGHYAFRNKRARVLNGNAPLLIEPGSLTLPAHLQEAGYHTAVIGKWHLGLGAGEVDWNGPVTPGPLEIGFDHSYLLPATNDRVPCAYLAGHHIENLDPSDPITVSYRENIGARPTGLERPDLLRYAADRQHAGTIINHISRIGWQAGGKAAEWVDEEMADRFTERAIDYIEERERLSPDQPWFLYFNLHDVHEPRLPHPRFLGTSGHGVRGDAMLEIDWCVGALVDLLQRLNIREKTLIVFASDNGPVITDGYGDGSLAAIGDHTPAGAFRGGKYQAWEGGTRLPFIVSWPGRVTPGVSTAMFSQLDLLATVATLVEQPLPADKAASIDSRDVLPALLGETDRARAILLTQSVGRVSIRWGDWKYIPAGGREGGWAARKHGGEDNPLHSPTMEADPYLFNLADDPGEMTNVADKHPEVAEQLRLMLQDLRADPDAVEVLLGK